MDDKRKDEIAILAEQCIGLAVEEVFERCPNDDTRDLGGLVSAVLLLHAVVGFSTTACSRAFDRNLSAKERKDTLALAVQMEQQIKQHIVDLLRRNVEIT
jgi:hypothetical protein